MMVRCDEVFSRLVRDMAGRCEARHQHDLGNIDWHPDCAFRLECSHLVSRNVKTLRVDFDNAMSLCGGAHRHIHAYPGKHIVLAQLVKGDDIWDRLHERDRELLALHDLDWFAEYEILTALEQSAVLTRRGRNHG